MKTIKIIALSGDRESGKDTIADILVDNWGYQKLELAKLAKEILCKKVGIKIEELKDRETKELYRPEIIEIAEKLKEIDINFHCKVIINQILDLVMSRHTKFVVSDFRFPSEVQFFRTYWDVDFKSLYISSDLGKPHPEIKSESYIHSYFEKNNDGIIINNQRERYDRDNKDLISQLVKFVN